jgi:hypothetical protein
MYHASKNSDGTYSASVAVSYDLSSYALRNAPSVSADAAGLPMLPGLVRYDEIASGSINHALRFATNELRNTYIWPARGAAGSSDSDSSLPPHGQRFRLKASFDTSKYPAQERIVLEALKKYGMILADWNGGDSSTFHICAVPDSRVTINWDSFSAIHMTDFEAVDESSLMINKDSGQARTTSTTITPTPTPTPIPTVTPTSTPTPVPTSTPTPTPTVSTPKITVTSPNGGESWSAGSTRRITWTSSGSVGSSMKIELMKGSAVVQTILSSTENDGSYSSWTISSGLQGTDYRIRISSTSNPAIADTSNSVFTITGASAVVSNQQEIGIFTVGLWYVDNNGTGIFSTNDKTTSFGITGDIPVSGDWNVDGRTEIGVFRPSTHMFYLDYNGNGVWSGAVTDRSYNFGITGDIPVSGDWNVDGRTEIGVFRPSTNMFYLDYNGNGVWSGAVTDRSYNFGITGDIPVSGDWNVDGRTEIGVFRPSTNMFYLDYNGNGVWNGAMTDITYNFGTNGGTPVSGKWS